MNLKRITGALFALALLAVFAGCASTETRRGTGAYVDDKVITAKIKTDLAADPITSATNINIETYNGAVQLNGFVTTQESIRRAEEIARETEGVKSVQNNLVLRPGAPTP